MTAERIDDVGPRRPCTPPLLRGFMPPMKKLVLLALFALACGSETPVPGYPFPASPPLEETDLAMYLDTAGEEEEVVEEDENWDDGMDDAEEPAPTEPAPTEAAPAEAAAAEPAPAEAVPAPARRRPR